MATKSVTKNYIYNLMGVIPATLSIPLNTALKIYGKIGYGKKTRRRIEIMEERINALTNEQVEIILREQTAGQKIDLNFPNVVEVLMERRIKKYQQDKLQEVNTKIDNIASDLARTSRSKIVQVMAQERVFINGQCETKPSKAVKMGDVITIRGKGRFVVKEIKANTRSGRMVVSIDKYV